MRFAIHGKSSMKWAGMILSSALALTACSPASEQKPADAPQAATPQPSPQIAPALALMDQAINGGDFSGAIAVMENGKLVYAKASGLADMAAKAPYTVQTRFKIASVGKFLTAAATLMALDEAGKSVDDKVAPLFATDYPDLFDADVTFADLLNHHTDTTEFFDAPDADQRLRAAKNDHDLFNLSVDAQTGPIHASTEDAHYSNTNYIFLGEIIARLRGQPYEALMQKALFDPFGVKSALFARPAQVAGPGFAKAYVPLEGSAPITYQLSTDPLANSVSNSAGGLYITASDLAKLADDLGQHADDKKSIRARMCVPVLNTRPDHYYGYGCSLLMQDGQIVRMGHSGGAPGVSAVLNIYPELHVTVAIISNHDGGSRDLASQVNDALLGGNDP